MKIKNKMIIYKIINLINGKVYIGQDTKNNPNYFGSGIYIKRAIKKYGKESFRKEILEYCENQKELNKKEIYWIKRLSSKTLNGYNMADGGNGVLNPSKETRKKRSESLKSNKEAMKKVKNLGKLNMGKPCAREVRQKISKSRKNSKKAVSQAKKQAFKMGKLNKGKIPWNKGLTKETNDCLVEIGKNISKALKGRILSKEWKKKISKSSKGRIFSEKHKENLSKSHRSKKNKIGLLWEKI